MPNDTRTHAIVVGGGFCGLSAAFELGRLGVRVTLIERDAEVGGLAGSFDVGGQRLEKFYHHWFNNDRHVMELVDDLGRQDRVLLHATRTGMYYANRFHRLSTPMDLLRFSPLGLIDRIRLGLLALRVRRVDDWRSLEHLSAADWLRDMAGERVYRVVWEPLLRGKFGAAADDVSAVWFWNKLKLRGGSRGKGGEEQLAYYRGGFAALADDLVAAIESRDGRVLTGHTAQRLAMDDGRISGVVVDGQLQAADQVLVTTPLPGFADLLPAQVDPDYLRQLRRIRYLSNVCVVLVLDRSLGKTYWLNVNDPDFPFVAVIEHTNFESSERYAGRHIVYLSKYLAHTDPLYHMADAEVVDFTVGHLQRMFPAMARDWLIDAHVWRARHSQPIVERHYAGLIPPTRTPVDGLYLASMAQIYPQDRGTNYAIRQGRSVARDMAADAGLLD